NKYINLIVHDGGVAFLNETGVDIEVNGSIFYNNGWQESDRGHGHATYVKSPTTPVVVQDNVTFNQYGLGVHGYTDLGSGSLNGISIIGNASFNNGSVATFAVGQPFSQNILMGGDRTPVNQGVVSNNMTYFSPGIGATSIKLGYAADSMHDVTAQNNYAAGGGLPLDIRHFTSLTVGSNTLIEGSQIGDSEVVNLDTTRAGFSWTSNTLFNINANAWRTL